MKWEINSNIIFIIIVQSLTKFSINVCEISMCSDLSERKMTFSILLIVPFNEWVVATCIEQLHWLENVVRDCGFGNLLAAKGLCIIKIKNFCKTFSKKVPLSGGLFWLYTKLN